jgi:hypothetical protein
MSEIGGLLNRPPKNIDEQTIFINESGLYSLILSSKKKKAKEFKHFITNEILPAIRKTGKYEIQPQQQTKAIQQKHDILDYCDFLIKHQDVKTRDELFVKDVIMNQINILNSQKLITNGNEEWSISRRLQYYGIINKKEQNKGIQFGKIMKQAYINHYKKLPTKRVQYVDGTNRDVNNYTLEDWLNFGDEELKKYFNTK